MRQAHRPSEDDATFIRNVVLVYLALILVARTWPM
jgi:hypothetical protein